MSLTAAAMFDEEILRHTVTAFKIGQFAAFRLKQRLRFDPVKKGVDQYVKTKIGQMKVGHQQNRIANSFDQGQRVCYRGAAIKVGRKLVPLSPIT